MLRQLITGVLFFLGLTVFAQKGELTLFVIPASNYKVLVDEKDLYQDNSIVLKEGEHNIKIWAPGYEIFDTTLTIFPNQESSIITELVKYDAYQVYLKETERYETNLKLMKVPTAFITAGGFIFSTVAFAQMVKSHNELNNLEEEYFVAKSPDEVTAIKLNIKAERADYQQRREKFLIGSAGTLFFGGLTAFLWHRAEKMKVPIFKDKFKIEFNSYLSQAYEAPRSIHQFTLRYEF